MSRICCDWSKLCPDVLGSILERLSTKDFHRARSVCSNWYSVSVSRTSMRQLYPWRILFNKENSTLLFDPGEEKTHEIQHHPEIDFSKKYVMDSCSNWLLLVDSTLEFFLLNVFTGERINLPSMESFIRGKEDGKEEWVDYIQHANVSIFSKSSVAAVLWMDERTGDYVVAWCYKQHYLFSYKKGDDSWCNLGSHKCVSMAYKKSKLYVFTSEHYIKILDLSGDYPNEIIEGNPYRNHRFEFVLQPGEFIWMKKVAITNSGEVLIVV
ncbi:unnamed protein product [Microthlaspi erraticum]|uniref:F-box domain-containing protein n=1 Tax=Microthlaspi erraticum TaxID=1685480 RepID=A0A6D2KPM8_9BRAS|nr:unnamed protein product [Microthlaspi erraticum]